MSSANERKPHEALAGLDLPGGWKVRKQVNKTDSDTGGHFSCGYIVESSEVQCLETSGWQRSGPL